MSRALELAPAAGAAPAARPSREQSFWERVPLIRSPTTYRSGNLELVPAGDGAWIFRGFFSSSAVVETDKHVIVVDTQVTPEGGERLRDEIAARIGKPIALVVNTHYHGDHVGGNAAFLPGRIVASAHTARLMRERDHERYEYADTFGLFVQHMHETSMPTEIFDDRATFVIDGERIDVFSPGAAETPDAQVVWVPSRRILCSGDGVAVEGFPWTGVPFLDEGLQTDGAWRAHLQALSGLGARTLLPGHGPALVGEGAIAARLALLDEVFARLFEEAREALAATSAVDASRFEGIVLRIEERLARYRDDDSLKAHVVSLRFAIRKALHSSMPDRRGKGWWHDLRPSLVDEARAGDAPFAALTRVVTDNPRDAHGHAVLANFALARALKMKPIVDATEWLKHARHHAEEALALDENEPLALAALGCVQTWGAMVVCHPMHKPIETLTRALQRGVSGNVRRRVLFFLGKAHQLERRDDDSDAAFRELLPMPLRSLYPVLRPRLRGTP